MESFSVLVNLFFALSFGLLIGTFGWELKVKINHRAKKILLSKTKTLQNNILLVNLVQLLVSCVLISTLKMSKTIIFPGQDYSFLCFACLIMKILQLRKETFFQDSVGILSLLMLTSLLIVQTSGSIFQSSSIFFNWLLFFLPFPVISTAFVIVTRVFIEIFPVLSSFSVISSLSAVFILISLKKFRITFVILLVLLALKMIIQLKLSQHSLENKKQEYERKNNPGEIIVSSYKKKNISIYESMLYHKDLDIKGFEKKRKLFSKYENICPSIIKEIKPTILLNVNLKKEASEQIKLLNVCLQMEISHVFYYCDKDEGTNLQVVLDHQKRNVLENLIDVVKHVNETKELEEVSISTDVTPGDQKLKQVTSIPDDLSNGDKFEETLNPQKLIKEESNYPKETKSQNNDYLIFSSQFDSNGHCSVEALDVSESSFLLKNFFQLNNLFKNIFPIFPSYLPFQLQKISLLGFSHICLSLPGSEVSLINLGLTEEKGINNSNENKCNCEPKNEESIMHHFSNAFKNFKNFFLSLI